MCESGHCRTCVCHSSFPTDRRQRQEDPQKLASLFTSLPTGNSEETLSQARQAMRTDILMCVLYGMCASVHTHAHTYIHAGSEQHTPTHTYSELPWLVLGVVVYICNSSSWGVGTKESGVQGNPQPHQKISRSP